MKKIKGFKGFNKDLKCRDFQYEIGKHYHQGGVIKCCHNGFHLSENPIDILSYYTPNTSRYCKVNGFGDSSLCDYMDDQIAFSDIEINKEISIDEFAVECVLQTKHMNTINTPKYKINNGDYSSSVVYDMYSIAETFGFNSIAVSNNMLSVSVAYSNKNTAIANGNWGVSICDNGSHNSVAMSTGLDSIAITNGRNSVALTTDRKSLSKCNGKSSIALATGYSSTAIATKANSIAMATIHGLVSGVIGSWLILVEHNTFDDIIDIKSVKVDGKKIKENTKYYLFNGEIKEYK